MSDSNVITARKDVYQKLLKANPLADRQILKQLAYDSTQKAVKGLQEIQNGDDTSQERQNV